MPKRRWLKREIVVETAVTLADEAGSYSTVTLTAVAKALNVRTPSLYNHVANLSDLQNGMHHYGAKLLLTQIREAIGGRVGEEALLQAANVYRAFAKAHPGIYPLIIRAPEPDQPDLVALSNEMLQLMQLLLATMGLRDEAALHAIRGYRAVLHGFAALESGEGFKMPLDLDESFHRLVRSFLDGIQK